MSEHIMLGDVADKEAMWLPYEMVTSPAWRSLSGEAVKVYVELRRGFDGDEGDWDAIRLMYDMTESPAWRSLSGAAAKVYVEFASRFNGANNGDLSLSIGEGKRLLNLGKSKVMPALNELQVKGLICKTGVGHASRAATHRLTEEPYDGEPATRDWKSWRPMEQRQ